MTDAASGDSIAAMARRLGERHVELGFARVESDRSLLNYSEVSRADDWSLRSGLMRLAQPEPVLVREVLERVRRLDAAMSGPGKVALRHGVEVEEDARVSAVARLAFRSTQDRSVDGLVAASTEAMVGYSDVVDVTEDERGLAPLLQIALRLEELAEVVTSWAAFWTRETPATDVASRLPSIDEHLETLAVPRETWDGRRGPGRERR